MGPAWCVCRCVSARQRNAPKAQNFIFTPKRKKKKAIYSFSFLPIISKPILIRHLAIHKSRMRLSVHVAPQITLIRLCFQNNFKIIIIFIFIFRKKGQA